MSSHESASQVPALFTIRKNIFSLLHQGFQVFDANGHQIANCRMKAFRLREDLRIYRGADSSQEIATIKARSIIDFSSRYTVAAPNGQIFGYLKRAGFKSMLRDEWELQDPNGSPVITIREESMLKAIVRRTVEAAAMFMPQKYVFLDGGGQIVGEMKQNFNPFVQKVTADFTRGATLTNRVPAEMLLATALMLCAVEGRQD